MPPTDDISDYLSALTQAKANQQSAEASRRQDELAHAREVAALKSQERAEEERLLQLRIQAAQAERSAQAALHAREESARSAEKAERDHAEQVRREAEARKAAEEKSWREQEDRERRRQAQAIAEEKAERERAEREQREAEAKRAAEENTQRERGEQERRRQAIAWMDKHECQWDETLAEYAQRLTSLGLVELGHFSFNPSDYDVSTGHFPLPSQIEWHRVIPEDQKPLDRLLWIAPDREAARKVVTAGRLPLMGTLTAQGKQFAIKQFAIHFADRAHLLKVRVVAAILDSMVSIQPGSVRTKAGIEVRVDQAYSICKFPVTQQWYEAVMQCNPSHLKRPNFPVNSVSWNDAQAFCQRLNTLARTYLPTGKRFAIPS